MPFFLTAVKCNHSESKVPVVSVVPLNSGVWENMSSLFCLYTQSVCIYCMCVFDKTAVLFLATVHRFRVD